jgi:hypothetical protein
MKIATDGGGVRDSQRVADLTGRVAEMKKQMLDMKKQMVDQANKLAAAESKLGGVCSLLTDANNTKQISISRIVEARLERDRARVEIAALQTALKAAHTKTAAAEHRAEELNLRVTNLLAAAHAGQPANPDGTPNINLLDDFPTLGAISTDFARLGKGLREDCLDQFCALDALCPLPAIFAPTTDAKIGANSTKIPNALDGVHPTTGSTMLPNVLDGDHEHPTKDGMIQAVGNPVPRVTAASGQVGGVVVAETSVLTVEQYEGLLREILSGAVRGVSDRLKLFGRLTLTLPFASGPFPYDAMHANPATRMLIPSATEIYDPARYSAEEIRAHSDRLRDPHDLRPIYDACRAHLRSTYKRYQLRPATLTDSFPQHIARQLALAKRHVASLLARHGTALPPLAPAPALVLQQASAHPKALPANGTILVPSADTSAHPASASETISGAGDGGEAVVAASLFLSSLNAYANSCLNVGLAIALAEVPLIISDMAAPLARAPSTADSVAKREPTAGSLPILSAAPVDTKRLEKGLENLCASRGDTKTLEDACGGDEDDKRNGAAAKDSGDAVCVGVGTILKGGAGRAAKGTAGMRVSLERLCAPRSLYNAANHELLEVPQAWGGAAHSVITEVRNIFPGLCTAVAGTSTPARILVRALVDL